MAKANHLSRRRGSPICGVRLRVPADLAETVGRVGLTKTTGAAAPHAAQRISRVIVGEREANLEGLRACRDVTTENLDAVAVAPCTARPRCDERMRAGHPVARVLETAPARLIERAQIGEFDMETARATRDASLEVLALRDAAGRYPPGGAIAATHPLHATRAD